jgi:Flp pilus assembly pilin Flp
LIFVIDSMSRSITHFLAVAIVSRPAGDRAMTFQSFPKRDRLACVLQNLESEGQGLVEYSLLIFLVSIASMAALTGLGVGIKTQLYDVILAMLPF